MQKELEDDGIIVSELPFEPVDPVGSPLEGFLPAWVLHLFGDRPAVPAPGEDADPATGGNAQPESPEKLVIFLFPGWSFNGMQRIPAGVEGLDDLMDAHGDARGIPAFNNNEGGNIQVTEGPLENTQPLLERREGLRILFFIGCFCEIQFVEHLLFPRGGVVHVFVGHDG